MCKKFYPYTATANYGRANPPLIFFWDWGVERGAKTAFYYTALVATDVRENIETENESDRRGTEASGILAVWWKLVSEGKCKEGQFNINDSNSSYIFLSLCYLKGPRELGLVTRISSALELWALGAVSQDPGLKTALRLQHLQACMVQQ